MAGHGGGVADDVVRAETGCERLQDRWQKLKLGYWRHLFTAKPGRLVRVVAESRYHECMVSDRLGSGNRGWMHSARDALYACGLGSFWHNAPLVAQISLPKWRDMVYRAVNNTSDNTRRARMQELPSTTDYVNLKEWGVNTEEYSYSSGETGRLGQHVPERYLDDRDSLKGTRLKLLCRVGAIPTMKRIGRELKTPWPVKSRICFNCSMGVVEDVHHFLMDCPLYDSIRVVLLSRVAGAYDGATNNATNKNLSRGLGSIIPLPREDRLNTCNFKDLDSKEQSLILLGKRFNHPQVEDKIDKMVKRFLVKAWNLRKPVTMAINSILGTNYDVFVAPSR